MDHHCCSSGAVLDELCVAALKKAARIPGPSENFANDAQFIQKWPPGATMVGLCGSFFENEALLDTIVAPSVHFWMNWASFAKCSEGPGMRAAEHFANDAQFIQKWTPGATIVAETALKNGPPQPCQSGAPQNGMPSLPSPPWGGMNKEWSLPSGGKGRRSCGL